MEPRDLRTEAAECTKAIWDRIRQGEELPELDDQLSRLARDIQAFVPKHTTGMKDSFLSSRTVKVESALQELAVALGYVSISRSLMACAGEGVSALSVYVAARDILRDSPLTEELPGEVAKTVFNSWILKP